MYVYIHCFQKGLFINRRFVKALKIELQKEFGDLVFKNHLYSVYTDDLVCHIDKSYNSVFYFDKASINLDKIISVMISISKEYKISLACTAHSYNERDLVEYIRSRVSGTNISISARLNL